MTIDARPLTLAELLDRSFSTYKRHLWLFVGIMAVPSVFAMTMAVVIQLLNGGPVRPGTPPGEVLRRAIPMLAGTFAFSLVYMLAYMFALAATSFAVSRLYLGRSSTVREAYGAVTPRGWRIVGLMLWAWLLLGGTLLGLMLVAGIASGVIAALISPILSGLVMFGSTLVALGVVGFMAIRYGVSVPAIVLENISARTALRRSVELTEEHRGRVFLVMLCAAVIAYATAALLQGPFMFGAFMAGAGTPLARGLTIIGAILGGLGGMFSGPIMIIGLAFMYYDLRIRKEGLDLHLMLDALDPSSSLGVAPAPRQA